MKKPVFLLLSKSWKESDRRLRKADSATQNSLISNCFLLCMYLRLLSLVSAGKGNGTGPHTSLQRETVYLVVLLNVSRYCFTDRNPSSRQYIYIYIFMFVSLYAMFEEGKPARGAVNLYRRGCFLRRRISYVSSSSSMMMISVVVPELPRYSWSVLLPLGYNQYNNGNYRHWLMM